jgi:YVTN family beta-propeller protein
MHRNSTVIVTALLGPIAWLTSSAAEAAPVYRSPRAVAVAADGQTLFVADKTAGCVTIIDAAAGKPLADVATDDEPSDLALSADGSTLFVALRKAHAVAVVDTASRKVTGRIDVGRWPVAVTLVEKTGRLYTANQGDHTVSTVDLASGKELRRQAVVRQPVALAATPDGLRLVVANLLPRGAGTDPTLAAEVSVIDTVSGQPTATVKLPPGSTTVTAVCTSPDGRWAYLVHALGRFNLPITQLDRGWVHTYALSILDLSESKLAATVLLDDLSGGAADPSDLALSPDGATLWIAHAGVHEVSIVDVARLHDLLRGKVWDELAKLKDGTRDNIWVRVSRDPGTTAQLANDLTALYIAGLIRRVPSGGNGPRGLALSPDAKKLFVANYFSGTIGVLDARSGKSLATISTGAQPEADAARRGEIYFHDATQCFQRWHSCATCHPDGRVDGLPWDFMRDGIGNGKDVISLVYMPRTSPHNRRASRPDPKECMRTGVAGSHLVIAEETDVDDLLAYVDSLQPEPNPALAADAKTLGRGKAIFEGKADCARCHPAPYFTDQKMHNVGAISRNEPDGRYDTPSLVECYRTSPYLHDGRAVTLKETLTRHDPDGEHGKTNDLTPEEIDDLVEYLKSL